MVIGIVIRYYSQRKVGEEDKEYLYLCIIKKRTSSLKYQSGGCMKIYCASDLHIGYENANYPKIEEFFDIVKDNADELILCGDVFDLWRCPFELIKKAPIGAI
jgi:hypothetical protein